MRANGRTRSNEPTDLLEQFAAIWQEAREDTVRGAYLLAQHLDGKHDGERANERCIACQEDCRDA